MFNWLREITEILSEYRERKHELRTCGACEVLKQQIALLNQEKKELLNRVLREPEVITEESKGSEVQFKIPNRHVPWRVQQQALEMRDREKKVQKQLEDAAPKPKASVEEIERELGVAE